MNEIKDALTTLKLDLATRSNNENVGSGLGGNTSELFFLLDKDISVFPSTDDSSHFYSTFDKKISFAAPAKLDLKQARSELTEFINAQPDKKDISLAQLVNPSFLKDLHSNSLEIKMLILASQSALDLSTLLKPKISLEKEMRNVLSKEILAFKYAFLKSIDFPQDYLCRDEVKDNDPIALMFSAHPIWGPKAASVRKRQAKITKHLVSQEELDQLNFIGTFPPHIVLLVCRVSLGLESIVQLNLDERVTFFDKINKLLND